jgi:glutaredoxin-related protein
MLKIYGTMQCKDCVECVAAYQDKGVSYEFLEFHESLVNLKEFLLLRDTNPVFAELRGSGKIGIPCIVTE